MTCIFWETKQGQIKLFEKQHLEETENSKKIFGSIISETWSKNSFKNFSSPGLVPNSFKAKVKITLVSGAEHNGRIAAFDPEDPSSTPGWPAVIKFKLVFV